MKKMGRFYLYLVAITFLGFSSEAIAVPDAACKGKPAPTNCIPGCTNYVCGPSGDDYEWKCAVECRQPSGGGGGGGSGDDDKCIGNECTGLAPPKTKSINYSSQITNATAAVNFNYSDPTKFPSCENDPSGFSKTQISTSNIDSTLNSVPPYPDINDRMAAGATKPKDQCVVTSRVLCRVGTSDDQPCTSTNQPITSALGAVCPDGYVQVGAFNMQPEVIHSTSVEPYYPVTMPEYQKYITTLGYHCGNGTTKDVISSIKEKDNACALASNVVGTPNDTNDPGWNPWGYLFNTPIPNGIYATIKIDGTPVTNYYAGYYVNTTIFNDYCYTLGAHCDSGYRSSDKGCPAPNNIWERKWNVEKRFYQCWRDPGTYFSTRSAPRSFICARIKNQYDKANP